MTAITYRRPAAQRAKTKANQIDETVAAMDPDDISNYVDGLDATGIRKVLKYLLLKSKS